MSEIPQPDQKAIAPQQDAKSFDKTQDKPAAKPAEKFTPTPTQPGEDSAAIAIADGNKEVDAAIERAKKNSTALPKTEDGKKVKNPADEATAKAEELQKAQAAQQAWLDKIPPSVRPLVPELEKKIMSKELTQEQVEQQLNKAIMEAKAADVKKASELESPHESTISSQASDEPVKSQEEKNAAINKAVEPIKNVLKNPLVKAMTFPLKVLKAVFIDIPVRFLQWAVSWIKQ